MAENFSIQTFEFADKKLVNAGTSHVGRTKAANKYGINMRDFRQLYIDVSLIEPRRQMIIISLSYINCIVTPNKIHIIVNRDTERFIQEFPALFAQADSFDAFELKCVESLFIYISDEFSVLYDAVQREIGKTNIFSNQKALAEQRQNVTELQNDVNRAIDALNLLMDNDDDMVALSFQNQAQMPQYQQRLVPKAPPTLQYLQEQTDSDSDSSQSSQQIQLVYSAATMTEFIESYMYSLHALQVRTQSIETQIHTTFNVLSIKLASYRNVLMMFQVFMEILTSTIAISNLIAVMPGSNVLNYWFSDPPGPWSSNTTLEFWSIAGVSLGMGMVYAIVSWLLFIIQYRKMK